MDSLKFDSGDFYEYLLRNSSAERNDTHGVKIKYQNLESHSTKNGSYLILQGVWRNLVTLKFYVLTLHFYFNCDPNILVIPYSIDRLKEIIDSFIIQYVAYVLIIMHLPDDCYDR